MDRKILSRRHEATKEEKDLTTKYTNFLNVLCEKMKDSPPRHEGLSACDAQAGTELGKVTQNLG